MQAGAPQELTQMGGTALNIVRIEAGLKIACAEFVPEYDTMEAGFGLAADFKK